MLSSFFLFEPADAISLLATPHSTGLVGLSVAVAVFASCMALYTIGQAQRASRAVTRRIMLTSGGVALGGGVWAMHFIGMLAFDLCVSVRYDYGLTLLSMLPSVAASVAAMALLTRPTVNTRQLLTGGALVGSGIGAMHYSGMAAMKMGPILRYDPALFALSIVLAIALATLAFKVKFSLIKSIGWSASLARVLLSGAVMGLAISGMHYTGMAATRLTGVPDSLTGALTSGPFYLGMVITAGTILLTATAAGVNALLSYRALVSDLSSSESRMRALMSTAVDGVITLDSMGVVQAFNASAERIFGWRADEVIGRSFDMLVPEPERSVLQQQLEVFRHTGMPALGRHRREIAGLRRNGSTVPLRMSVGHTRVAGEHVFVGYVEDISHHKEMERALRDNERQYRSLISNIPGIAYRCLMNRHGTLLFVSDAVQGVTGYPSADFVGESARRNFAQITHPEDAARNAQQVREAIEARQPFVIEYRITHRDGSTRWMWENGRAAFDEDGAVAWIDGVILDITQRHEMEFELRSAKERAELAAASRSAFLASMSHEIRTPMNAIIGFTDVLLTAELAADQRRQLDIVSSSARSLLRLLNDILDSARLERGAVELEILDFDLPELLSRLVSTLEIQANAKGLALSVDLSPTLGTYFRGDSLRIGQVLTNLIGNAIKFTHRGSVQVRVRRQGSDLHFSVEDSGIGIAGDRLPVIFDPFTQADASMSRRFGGTGLGTSICKQLVELMGGRIWADSTPDQGSTFHFVLPLEAGSAPLRVPGRPTILPTLKVMVVDDVAQNVELLASLLQPAGHSVVTCTSAADAIVLAARESFDLILMDLHMPQVSGLAAARAIREAEARDGRRAVPIIALTASVLDADREAAHSAGMDGFAAKPIELDALYLEIARVLGHAAAGMSSRTSAEVPPATVIDLQRARSIWRDEARVKHVFVRLLDDMAGLVPQLRHHAGAHAHADMIALTHRLRGVAANVGAVQLAHCLGALETAVTAGPAAPLAMLIAEVEHALHALRNEVAGLQPPTRATRPDAGARAGDAGAALRHAQTLLGAIERGALDDAALARLMDSVDGDDDARLTGGVVRAIEDFDFERATADLKRLIDALQAELAPT